MKHISIIIILILFSTILNAEYFRTIRVGSFSTDETAQKFLVQLKKYFKNHDNLVKLQKKHKFEVKVRKSGKYYVALIEPFTHKPVVQEVLDTLRLKYKDIYATKLSKEDAEILLQTISKKETVVATKIAKVEQIQEKPKVIKPEVEEKKIIKPVLVVKKKIKEIEKPEVKKVEIKKVTKTELKQMQPTKKEEINKEDTLYAEGENYLWKILLLVSLLIIFILIVKIFKNKKEKKRYIKNEIEYKQKLEQIKKKDMLLSHTSNGLKISMITLQNLSNNLLKEDVSIMHKDPIKKVNNLAANSIKNIEDILNISNILSDNFELEQHEFNFNHVIDDVLTTIVMQAKDKNITISLDSEIPSLVIGDSLRIAQVLRIVLSQAIALTKEGEILLNIRQVSRNKEIVKLEFFVSDIGMLEEKIQNLYKDDFGVNNWSISKKFIEMMDGQISLDNKINGRTTFSFDIVLRLNDADNRRQYRLPSSKFLNKKVLIVDSHAKHILALQKKFFYFDYQVDSIDSFEDPEFKDGEIYDLIVLNHSKLSSFSLRKIKEMQTKGFKVVLLSELYSKVSNAFLEKIDFDASLKIPFTQQSILDIIIDLDLSRNLNDKSRETELKEKLKKLGSKKILVADDNELNHIMIKDLLSDTGIGMKFVHDGEEAVRLIAKGIKFNLILMDINMPKLNGYETSKEIRKHKTYNNVKILALLSDEIESAIEKTYACGMQGNISKPIDRDRFYDEVLEALSSDKEVLNTIVLSQSIEESKGDEFEDLAISMGMKKFANNKELYKSTLVDFKAMHMNSVSVIEELCNDEYFKEAISLVSEVESIALSIGAYNLCESAAALEYELERGVGRNWKKLINSYNSSVEKVFDNIDAYLK